MRMPLKHPIGGSGDAGAVEAPEQGVKMETEVAVTAYEVSLDLDIIDDIVFPLPELEVHTDSSDGSGGDSETTPTTT
ncbi:E3 ubiquitin-protein ligase [Hordeum vulgare]|nr:E3 ubiquitin-protein ligase [Hordeum vulgare]